MYIAHFIYSLVDGHLLRYFTFFVLSFEVWCVFHIYSTSHFGPATFRLLSSHLRPVATTLERDRAATCTTPSL